MKHYISIDGQQYTRIALKRINKIVLDENYNINGVCKNDEIVFVHKEDEHKEIWGTAKSLVKNTLKFRFEFEVDNGYIFTNDNVKLRKFTEDLENKKGINILLGNSGVGKTTFLKSAFCNKNVTRYTYEQILGFIIQNLKMGELIPMPENNTVIVEDFDYSFCFKKATQCEFRKVFREWQKTNEEMCIICTFGCIPLKKEIPFEGDIMKMRELTLTSTIIRMLASKKGIILTEEEVGELSLLRMNEVDGKLNVIMHRNALL